MSRRHVLNPHKVITNGDMSGDLSSSSTNIQQLDTIHYLVVWSGTAPVGEIVVQESVDGETWYDLDFLSAISVTGNTGHHDIYLKDVAIKFVRAKYVRTSGTGTLQVYIEGKGMGA